jgi:hypothetical protein
MRYHWGLAVGHLYSHGNHPNSSGAGTAPVSASPSGQSTSARHTPDNLEEEPSNSVEPLPLFDREDSDVEDPQFTLRNREDDDIDDNESSHDELDIDHDEDSDSMFAARDDMYGNDGW